LLNKMKGLKILFSAVLICLAHTGFSQTGFSYLGIRSGYTIERGYSASLFYSIPNKNNSSFDFGAQYFTSSLKNQKLAYRNILGSLDYKNLLCRSVNTSLNMVIGAVAGSDFKKFIAGPEVGFEVIQNLRGCDLILSNRNQYILLTDKEQRLRFGFEFGIRLPLN